MVMIPILGTRAVFDPEIAGFRFDGQRRRRSLISAQGWSAATSLGSVNKHSFQTLKGLVPHRPNAFSVDSFFVFSNPGLSLRSNPGLKLANAFGVKAANVFGVKQRRSSALKEPTPSALKQPTPLALTHRACSPLLEHVAKCYGVAQFVDARDAVLPD